MGLLGVVGQILRNCGPELVEAVETVHTYNRVDTVGRLLQTSLALTAG